MFISFATRVKIIHTFLVIELMAKLRVNVLTKRIFYTFNNYQNEDRC